MPPQPIIDAVARAMPNVAELLDRHARWSAQMCRNVPSPAGKMFQNVPSEGAREPAQTAEMFRNVPESSGMFRDHEKSKTNPFPQKPKRPLTYRQLACARLIVRGGGTLEIARHLGVEHHTIARWKRNPTFVAELERLRALLTNSAVARKAPTPVIPPPAPAPRLTPVPMTPAQIAPGRPRVRGDDRADPPHRPRAERMVIANLA